MTGPEHINAKLQAKGQLTRFLRAIERQDRATVAKLLSKVREPDDGTIADLYLGDPNVWAQLKSIQPKSAASAKNGLPPKVRNEVAVDLGGVPEADI